MAQGTTLLSLWRGRRNFWRPLILRSSLSVSHSVPFLWTANFEFSPSSSPQLLFFLEWRPPGCYCRNRAEEESRQVSFCAFASSFLHLRIGRKKKTNRDAAEEFCLKIFILKRHFSWYFDVLLSTISDLMSLSMSFILLKYLVIYYTLYYNNRKTRHLSLAYRTIFFSFLKH